jgi:hypothetical protein
MTTETSKLLTKYVSLGFLNDARNCLLAVKEKGAIEIIYVIDKLVGESDCCIMNWTDASNFYRSASCILERSLVFLEHEASYRVQKTSESLYAAHLAAKPYVIEHLNGQGNQQRLASLGFWSAGD